MQVQAKKIITDNPAAHLINKYRCAATNHINLALRTMIANAGNHAAVMATANQLYEDLNHMKLIGLLHDREYDAAAAIAFEVIAGASTDMLVLPDMQSVRDEDDNDVRDINEAKHLVRLSIIEPINKCICFIVNDANEIWLQDGWKSVDEYQRYLMTTVHNLMRIGHIIGATTAKDHNLVSNHMQKCMEAKQYIEFVLE
jgi:hypothetical protein